MDQYDIELRLKSVTENYRERIERIALFDCLYKLEKKVKRDRRGKTIDFLGLGLLTLLFFFENMLMRNKKAGLRELTTFLYQINKEEIDLDEKGFEDIAKTIIESFRPLGGKRNFKTFHNWETRQEEKVEYTILKASDRDIKSNAQYYTLDDDGLELVFATREYFSEFQLSISQLLLRKQLEKGEFAGALRQIDEMRIEVETLEERILKIKYEVQRNILSEKTYERYRTLIEDINIRLKREGDEFNELKSFVDKSMDTLYNEMKDEKDRRAYEYLIKIQRELGEVHRFHRGLLQKSIELKTTTLQAAQESLYYVGIDSFNFKKEIVSRIFATPLPLEASRILINPFLGIEEHHTWSPLTVFHSQRILRKEEEESSKEFLKMKKEDAVKRELEIQQNHFRYITEIILKALDGRNRGDMEEIISFIQKSPYKSVLENTLFYHYFIVLHQKAPIIFNTKTYEKEILLQKSIGILERQYVSLNIKEEKGIIHVNDKFSVKNMIIELEGREDALRR